MRQRENTWYITAKASGATALSVLCWRRIPERETPAARIHTRHDATTVAADRQVGTVLPAKRKANAALLRTQVSRQERRANAMGGGAPKDAPPRAPSLSTAWLP